VATEPEHGHRPAFGRGLAWRIALVGIGSALVAVGIITAGVLIVGSEALAALMMEHGETASASYAMFDQSIRDVLWVATIVAIVAGAVDELGAGDNAKAAITTRGLAEVTRLGVAMGANPLTFAGLAGIGDILATSTSALSRNHRLGVELASGRAWADIEGTLPGVAEGAYTVRSALALAQRHGVEMPIAGEVHAVLYEGKDVRASVVDLLARESKDELAGLS